MKKGLSLITALILALTLASCGRNDTQEASEPIAVSSEPTSSVTKEIKSLTASTESKTEEASEEEYEEEEVYEEIETESTDVEMVAGDNSISLVDGETTLVTFTMPDDSPIYYKLTVNDSSTTAIMTHDIMEDISGRTIVEWFEGDCQDYIDFYKSIGGIDEDNEEMLTKDLNGKEVLICKDVREPDDQNKYEANYLIAVPVTDGIVLGFRVNSVNQTDSSAIFDDSTVDLLLDSCTF